MRVSFLNPYNTKYEAVSMVTTFKANLEFALLEKFILAGTVRDVDLQVESMKAFFLTETSLADVRTQVHALSKPLTKLINGYLSTGYGLPIPHHISQDLSKTRVFNYDHFLMVESDPKIESRIVELAGEAKDYLEKFISKKMSNDTNWDYFKS